MTMMKDKLLVLNCGSSSLKFKVFEAAGGGRLLPISAGLVEKIGEEGSRMKAVAGGDNWRKGSPVEQPLPDHRSALRLVSEFLSDSIGTSFSDRVHSVGHRVVHGGPTLTAPALITAEVRRAIKAAAALAPLHNPPNLQGIDAAAEQFHAAGAVHAAVFDTAFHHTIPPAAATYPLPLELCRRLSIRRYGFHGISYAMLVKAAARMLHRPISSLNLVISHLGAGSSMCAVRNGASIDTTMGLTPLEGLVMGTRCGDIDPSIITYLTTHGLDIQQVDELLNKRSGFLGLAGTLDGREVEAAAGAGDARAALALDVYVHRARKYLGAFFNELGGQVDAIVFSAGIGENGAELRSRICAGMEWAGVEVDEPANAATVRGREGDVSTVDSRVKVLVIPTDEQLEIAEQTLAVTLAARDQTRWPRPAARGGQRRAASGAG